MLNLQNKESQPGLNLSTFISKVFKQLQIFSGKYPQERAKEIHNKMTNDITNYLSCKQNKHKHE